MGMLNGGEAGGEDTGFKTTGGGNVRGVAAATTTLDFTAGLEGSSAATAFVSLVAAVLAGTGGAGRTYATRGGWWTMPL